MRKTTSGNKLIKDSCYMEENIEGGFDVEACACDYNLCNHSSNVFFQSHWLIVVLFLLYYVWVQSKIKIVSGINISKRFYFMKLVRVSQIQITYMNGSKAK